MSKGIENKIMLITYPDCMGNNFADLEKALQEDFDGAVGGLHILPFFPSSGDRGFAPTTYREVDPHFGTWEDIRRLSEKYYLMYDYMINHLSVHSEIYQDFLKNKDQSKYRNFFIRFKDFWPGGDPTDEDEAKIYKRRKNGQGHFITAEFADGTKEKIWCTFSDEQADINCLHSEEAKKYLRDNLSFLAETGHASLIRLDAFAYATKRIGTSCFFVEPEVWELMDSCKDILDPYGVTILPEIHENYFIQMKLAERDYYVYDFQLPMLLLNALYFHKTLYLKNWLRICSRKQFTTLDTHDGIGVVDVRYLMPDEEAINTKMKVFDLNPRAAEMISEIRGPIQKAFNTYQINCTYYSAVGEDDERYLLSRAVQFFAPGIPQVYYVGMLAGKNDYDLFAKTKEPRDVNRHYYSLEELKSEIRRPVVARLLAMMRFRNSHPAFNGEMELLPCEDHELKIRRTYRDAFAQLDADFKTGTFQITYTDDQGRFCTF